MNFPVKNLLNRHEFAYQGQIIDQPSETVPDQTMSIRTILDRYARGLPLDVKVPIWDENADLDDIIPNPNQLDLSERQEFAEQARQELEQIKQKLNTKGKKQKTGKETDEVTKSVDDPEAKRSAAE